MCRMVAYLGPSLPISTWLDAAPHSLERQSYAARELTSATVCADGWGFGFYTDTGPIVYRYRSTLPIWADVNRTELGAAISTRGFLAAVRSATDPLSVSAANTQPFTSGKLCFLHNGFIRDFSRKLLRTLRRDLSDRSYAEIQGSSDSEHVFALFRDEYDQAAASDPGRLMQATRSTLTKLRALATEAQCEALFTLIVSDGETLIATRSAVTGSAPSLYFLSGKESPFEGHVIASEPINEQPGWKPVPDESIVQFAFGSEPDIQQ